MQPLLDSTVTRFRGQSLLGAYRPWHGEVIMNTGLHGLELSRPASGGQLMVLPRRRAHSQASLLSKYLAVGAAGVLAVLTAAAAFTLAKWSPPRAAAGEERGRLMVAATAAAPETVPAPAASPVPDDISLYPMTVPQDATAIVTDGLT